MTDDRSAKERRGTWRSAVAVGLTTGLAMFVLFFVPAILFDRLDYPSLGLLGGLVLTAVGGLALFISWSYFRDKDTTGIYRGYREVVTRAFNNEPSSQAGSGKPLAFLVLGIAGALVASRGLGDIWLPLEIIAVLGFLGWVGVWFARLPDNVQEPAPVMPTEAMQATPELPPDTHSQSAAPPEDPVQAALDKVYARLKK